MHLAAVVSGEAEADFEKGYAVNFDGTRDAVRGDPGAARLPAAGDLRLVDRGLRRAVPGDDPRRLPPDAADELRHAEGDERAAARRLLAARASSTASGSGCRRSASGRGRRTRRRRGSSRTSCASRWPGSEAVLPVERRRAALAREPARGGRLLPARDAARPRPARAAAEPGDAGAVGDGRRADRGAAARGRATRRCALIRREPDPVIAADRRRLGDAARRRPRAGARLRRRRLVRRDHRRARRGRARRPDRSVNAGTSGRHAAGVR